MEVKNLKSDKSSKIKKTTLGGEKFLIEYTNRRKINTEQTAINKSDEEQKLENEKDYDSLCKKLEGCSVSKMPLLRKPVVKKTYAINSAVSSSNSPLAVEEFQKFLDEGGGHYGGWKVNDHLMFLKTRSKNSVNRTAEIVNEQFPDISVEMVLAHEEWYTEYTRLRKARKKAIENWRRDHKPVVKTMEKEPPETKPQAVQIKRDPKIKEKIDIWKAHTLARKLQKLEERQEEEKRKREEEERNKQLQEERRALVNRYKEEKLSYELAMKTAEETERLQAKQEALKRSALLLKCFRYEDRRFTERQRAKVQQKHQPKELPPRKNSAEGKRDPNRLLQPTLGWIYHTKKNEEDNQKCTSPLYIQHVRKLGKPEWRKGIPT